MSEDAPATGLKATVAPWNTEQPDATGREGARDSRMPQSIVGQEVEAPSAACRMQQATVWPREVHAAFEKNSRFFLKKAKKNFAGLEI